MLGQCRVETYNPCDFFFPTPPWLDSGESKERVEEGSKSSEWPSYVESGRLTQEKAGGGTREEGIGGMSEQ